MSTVVLDLANPEQALGLYLSALLRETAPRTPEVATNRALAPITVARPSVPIEVAVVDPVSIAVRTRDIEGSPDPVAPIQTPPKTSTPTQAPLKTPAPTQAAVQTPAPIQASVQKAAPPAAAPVPTDPFQSLLFQVAGLTVAVPLVELNGILRYPERLAAVPGLPSWGMGVVRYRDHNLVVVDSIDLFVPENLREATRARSQPRYLIVLGGGRFGLACDSVAQVVSLKPEEVRWRGERGRRPWLAGTVKDRLCALLEVPSLVRLLKAGHLEEQNP